MIGNKCVGSIFERLAVKQQNYSGFILAEIKGVGASGCVLNVPWYGAFP